MFYSCPGAAAPSQSPWYRILLGGMFLHTSIAQTSQNISSPSVLISSSFHDHDDHRGSRALCERSFSAPTRPQKASSDSMESLSSIELTWCTRTVMQNDPLGHTSLEPQVKVNINNCISSSSWCHPSWYIIILETAGRSYKICTIDRSSNSISHDIYYGINHLHMQHHWPWNLRSKTLAAVHMQHCQPWHIQNMIGRSLYTEMAAAFTGYF